MLTTTEEMEELRRYCEPLLQNDWSGMDGSLDRPKRDMDDKFIFFLTKNAMSLEHAKSMAFDLTNWTTLVFKAGRVQGQRDGIGTMQEIISRPADIAHQLLGIKPAR